MSDEKDQIEKLQQQKLELEIKLLEQQAKAIKRQTEIEEKRAKHWYLPAGKNDCWLLFPILLLLFVAFI